MKNVTLLFLLFLLSQYSKATTFFVAVTNFQFSPAHIPNVVVGDVIQFNFGGPNFHNAITAPLGIVPPGAADINSGPLGSVTTSFSYTVTKAGNYRYYCEIHSFDGVSGMVGTFSASDPLPVKLINFVAVYSKNMVTTKWQTVTEDNVAYFSLLKSTDGKKFAEAGRLNATGNSTTLQSYSFVDEMPGIKARYIYYMLKTVDNDGKYSLSEVKLVRNDQAILKLITQISPNPVSRKVGHLMFQFNADRNSEMKAIVKDVGGKTVMDLNLNANRGVNNGHIHMGSLPAGMYTIYFSLDGIKETQKILVR